MLDTMTMTKATGAFCGALLVLLLGKWMAEELYHVGHKGHGGDYHHEQAYKIDTGEDDHGGDDEVEEVDFSALLAAADPGKGEKVWKKCAGCHKLEAGANASGPYLAGIVDRPIGTAQGYGYSGALPTDQAWTPDNLNGFLADPKGWAPGTSMGFSGLKKDTDRANLVAYLQSLQ